MLLALSLIEKDIQQMCSALKLSWKVEEIIKEISFQYIISQFGVVICGIVLTEFSQINDAIRRLFPGWRIIFITEEDSVSNKREEVIWELMKSGYMRWIRDTYPREFKELILKYGYDKKIIKERLKIWKDLPKYRYLIEENKFFLNTSSVPTIRLLTEDPAFFDYMPEE